MVDKRAAKATLVMCLKESAMRLLSLFFAVIAAPLAAHELWIAPVDYQPDPGTRIEAELENGQAFRGIELPFLPSSIARFDVVRGADVVPVAGRMGDKPALAQEAGAEGLVVAVYQSMPSLVTYAEYAKFASFAAHKDLGYVRARHVARGLLEAGFKESYVRYSKALIGVGGAMGADARTGLETELVALDNPYVDDLGAGMRVQLFYRDATRADAQIEVFARVGDADAVITTVRTDGDGVAVVPVQPGTEYMLDAVVLREPDAALAAQSGAVWETLWANLTFRVPD